MSLQFILGAAGSGKSRYINRALIEEAAAFPERRFIALVPEQFTMETQKELVELHPGGSVLNIDILSFERLAYKVFEELSCVPETVLDDTGKSMLLRRACASVEKELEVYGGHLDRKGFLEELKSLMSEFGQYRVGEEELSALLEQTEKRPLLHRKLKDIRILFGAFREAMGEGMITAEELLPSLCRVLPRSERIRDSVIALDGFTGFTPAQYEVIGLLLRYGRKVMAAVTIDPAADPFSGRSGEDIFSLSRRTIGTLERLAEEAGTGRMEDVILEPDPLPRFRDFEELAFLSGQLFRYPCGSREEKTEKIFCTEEKDPAAETKALAARIGKLVREEGYRYREIAVVCGDLESYRPALEHSFSEAGIPAFLDNKRSLLTNPAVEYMRAALEVLEKDFSYESMFRYLKCGFLSFPEETLFELENYALALGIRGRRRWEKPWDQVYQGGSHVNLEELNRAREEAAAPLLELWKILKDRKATVRRMTEGLFAWMESQELKSRLSRMAERFAAEGEHSLAKEYDQAYGQILELFDRIVGLLGDEPLSLKVYREVLDAGFKEIRVGVIPAALDQILIGDMERSRLGNIRALFFIGVNDGNVPPPGRQGGILSEMDREALAPYVELAPARQESSLMDKFYFYLTVTKPSEKLYISYAAVDEAGEKKTPSPYIRQLLRVFPELSQAGPAEGGTLTETLALELLAAGMEEYRRGTEPVFWDTLYACLLEREESRDVLMRLTDAAFYSYEGDRISKAAARALYGDPLGGSVTRLETYAACAYAHFLSYGRAVGWRKVFELAALDL